MKAQEAVKLAWQHHTIVPAFNIQMCIRDRHVGHPAVLVRDEDRLDRRAVGQQRDTHAVGVFQRDGGDGACLLYTSQSSESSL